MKSHPCAIDYPVYKQPRPLPAFNQNHVFHTDALFIRMENMVGARSAQFPKMDVLDT
jgi:hypothetical protein